MRFILFLAASALTAAPLQAQKIGARTEASLRILSEAGAGNSDAELASAIAASAAQPLGSLENPVRVGGPDGERRYLARLRCPGGAVPKIGPRASSGPGAFGSVTATYSVQCNAAAPARPVVIDMYHAEHEESAAPQGLTLAGE